jgi:hypothetical protein
MADVSLKDIIYTIYSNYSDPRPRPNTKSGGGKLIEKQDTLAAPSHIPIFRNRTLIILVRGGDHFFDGELLPIYIPDRNKTYQEI